MSKTLLIHGTSVSHEYAFFRKRDITYGFFTGLAKEIDNKEVDLFLWSPTSKKISLLECLTGYKIAREYLDERKYIQTQKAISKLSEIIKTNNYETIITHSLGSYFLINYLNNTKDEINFKKIITLTSDAPSDLKLSNSEAIKKLEKKDLIWENYFCPWDQALFGSVLCNLKLPAGLLGSKSNKHLKNKLYPLKGSLNLHTTIIRDRKFLKSLIK